jgi:hypothetical protein
MRSGVPRLRSSKGSEAGGGGTHLDSCHYHLLRRLRRGHLSIRRYAALGLLREGKYDVDDQAAADPARDHVRYALEGMLNHPLAHAQLVPYESAESHQAFMKRFNQTMTLAVMFRDRPVGRVTPSGFDYALAEEDHPGWLDSLQTGARIMFAAGAAGVFFNSHRPLILNGPEEIDAALTLDLVASSASRSQAVTHGRLRAGRRRQARRVRFTRPLLGRRGLVRRRLLHPPDIAGRESLLYRLHARSVHRPQDGGRDPGSAAKW